MDGRSEPENIGVQRFRLFKSQPDLPGDLFFGMKTR
jgi:hypothetical protein